MNSTRVAFYILVPVAVLFAACENRFGQQDATVVFNRDSKGDITVSQTKKNVPQSLPVGSAVGGPKVAAITGASPTPTPSVTPSLLRFQIHNYHEIAVALGNQTSVPNPASARQKTVSAPEGAGFIYYKVWTTINKGEKGHPGKLDDNWSQGGGNGDQDNSTKPMLTTPIFVGTLQVIRTKLPPEGTRPTVQIKGQLAGESDKGTWWTWTGTWNPKWDPNSKTNGQYRVVWTGAPSQ